MTSLSLLLPASPSHHSHHSEPAWQVRSKHSWLQCFNMTANIRLRVQNVTIIWQLVQYRLLFVWKDDVCFKSFHHQQSFTQRSWSLPQHLTTSSAQRMNNWHVWSRVAVKMNEKQHTFSTILTTSNANFSTINLSITCIYHSQQHNSADMKFELKYNTCIWYVRKRMFNQTVEDCMPYMMPLPLHSSVICCKCFPYQRCYGEQKGTKNELTNKGVSC